MDKIYRVVGYVKLAKLWERSRDNAIRLHNQFFTEKFSNIENVELKGVFIDITGNKQIYKRCEMVKLLRLCKCGKVDIISTPSRAYLAANSEELCFLLKFIFDLPFNIDIVTDDDDRKINTLENIEKQRESLKNMAETYVKFNRAEYEGWLKKLVNYSQ